MITPNYSFETLMEAAALQTSKDIIDTQIKSIKELSKLTTTSAIVQNQNNELLFFLDKPPQLLANDGKKHSRVRFSPIEINPEEFKIDENDPVFINFRAIRYLGRERKEVEWDYMVVTKHDVTRETKIFNRNHHVAGESQDASFLRHKLNSHIAQFRVSFTRQEVGYFLQEMAEDPNVYGVFFRFPSGGHINPLHPLVANAILFGSLALPTDFEVLVFTYEKEPMKFSKKQQQLIDLYTEDYFNVLSQINSSFLSLSSCDASNLNLSVDVLNGPNQIITLEDIFNLDIQTKSTNSQTSANLLEVRLPFTLIPVQTIDTSLSLPYYGMVGITHANDNHGEYNGYQITPYMMSGNIGNSTIQVQGDERSSSTLLSDARDYVLQSVCTGDYNKYAPHGWFTLNRLNARSTYWDDYICTDFEIWAQASKNTSKVLYEEMVNEED